MKANRKPLLNNLELIHQGKVRDMYKIPYMSDLLLMMASNAVSTHNVPHKSLISGKGQCLTALMVFWLPLLKEAKIPHHVYKYGHDIFSYLPGKRSDYPDDLHLRAVIIRKLKPIPVEFIWRKYLTGSLWSKFYSKGIESPYQIDLPEGLKLMHKFDEPIFTPTDKSESDDPLPSGQTTIAYPEATELGLRLYKLGMKWANERNLEYVDFKCEFGVNSHGDTILMDEWLNTDSCRIVVLQNIKEGENPVWYDKQVIRDKAEELWGGGKKVPLEFPEETIREASARFYEIFERMTGKSLKAFQKEEM